MSAPRMPGHLLRWDGTGPEPGSAPPSRFPRSPGQGERFELTPRGVITLARIRFVRDPAGSTLWKVRRDPPGLIPVGRAGEGGPE